MYATITRQNRTESNLVRNTDKKIAQTSGAKVKIQFNNTMKARKSEMKIGNFAIFNIKKRVINAYINGNSESAYAIYRLLTGADVKESWRVVKPWIRKWEGKA